MLKYQEGYGPGFLFNIASGKQVDVYGKYAGVKRKQWWIFRESDHRYKQRIVDAEVARLLNPTPDK